ncbi:FAD-binding protein [Cupriavidus basilensis]
MRNGYLKRGKTVADLARQIGVDPATLATTIRRYNDTAQFGRDPEFGRGSKAYNRYQGDALHTPNPCVAPLDTGPFYALKLVPGDLGSFMGIRTNEHAQVVATDGEPIRGLYAAGNDAASLMGGEYRRCRDHTRPGADPSAISQAITSPNRATLRARRPRQRPYANRSRCTEPRTHGAIPRLTLQRTRPRPKRLY